MAKRLDKILVIDVESTCWEGNAPENQHSEIIEIGICVLDIQSGELSEPRGILIRPQYSEVSPFCTQLTTITPELLQSEGIEFPEACRILQKEYDAKARVWASWGDYDRNQFERTCNLYQIKYPFGTSHLNAKTLFALRHKLHHEIGMDAGLKQVGFSLEGTHHRGIDDAYNIARILKTLL
jgi:inhibitor of KinA sporulation pathway (predicted exonuclease)